VVSSVVSKVLRLRLLMPISGRFQRQRAVEFRGVMHLDQHVHAPVKGGVLQFGAWASETLAMMIRMQSAPQRARLGHLVGVVHEILAQRGQGGGGAGGGQEGAP
jgi:hypothetical protein